MLTIHLKSTFLLHLNQKILSDYIATFNMLFQIAWIFKHCKRCTNVQMESNSIFKSKLLCMSCKSC